jgi:hypothetical protein
MTAKCNAWLTTGPLAIKSSWQMGKGSDSQTMFNFVGWVLGLQKFTINKL